MTPGDDDRDKATQAGQPGRDASTTVNMGMQFPCFHSPTEAAARPPGDAPATAFTIPHLLGMPYFPGQGAATAQQPVNRIRSTSISNDGGSTLSGSDQGNNPDDPLGNGSKKRRTPRQQEQNKQAQQRYRQKRKAQFEDLQEQVNILTDQIRQFENDKHLRQEQELHLLRMKAAAQAQGIPTSTAFGGHPPVPSASAVSRLPTTNAAAASLMGGGRPASGTAPHTDPTTNNSTATMGSVLNNLLQAARNDGDIQAIENIVQLLSKTTSVRQQQGEREGGAPLDSSLTGFTGAAAKPTNHNPPSSTPGHPSMHSQPQAHVQIEQQGVGFSRSTWVGNNPRVPPDQLRVVMNEFRRQAAAVLMHLSAPPGSNVPRVEDSSLIQFREMAIEIASAILNVSAAQAADILQDGSPGTIPSAADSPGHWRGVVFAINLTPNQASRVLAWKESFLATLDQIYKNRAAIKTRVMQSVDGTDANATADASQSVESVLGHVARMHGYAFLAQAGSELVAEADDLLKNVEDERQAAINGLTMLLRSVLLPSQAAQYICVAHPFFWNVLAFSHAVAAVHGNGLRGHGADA